jgi:hypothetical protein
MAYGTENPEQSQAHETILTSLYIMASGALCGRGGLH